MKIIEIAASWDRVKLSFETEDEEEAAGMLKEMGIDKSAAQEDPESPRTLKAQEKIAAQAKEDDAAMAQEVVATKRAKRGMPCQKLVCHTRGTMLVPPCR